MKALQFNKLTNVLSIKEVPEPTIRASHDVIVRVANAGICGTDLHAIKGEFPLPDYPITLGHEFSGVVQAIGSEVTQVKVGDKVAVNPNKGCKSCHYCSRGQPHLCIPEAARDNIGFYRQGAWAPLCLAPEESVHRLPDSLSLEKAVLCEPLSCLAHGWEKIEPVKEDNKIIILGAGIIGLLWACVFHHRGFRDVTVSEPIQTRRDKIKDLDLGYKAVAPAELRTQMQAVDTNIDGVDLVVDCSGNSRAMEETLAWMKRGGKLCIFGVAPPHERISVIPYEVLNRELTIVGVVINPFTFPRAVNMAANMEKRYLDLKKLGVRKYMLEEFEEALRELKDGNISKAVFSFPM